MVREHLIRVQTELVLIEIVFDKRNNTANYSSIEDDWCGYYQELAKNDRSDGCATNEAKEKSRILCIKFLNSALS